MVVRFGGGGQGIGGKMDDLDCSDLGVSFGGK